MRTVVLSAMVTAVTSSTETASSARTTVTMMAATMDLSRLVRHTVPLLRLQALLRLQDPVSMCVPYAREMLTFA